MTWAEPAARGCQLPAKEEPEGLWRLLSLVSGGQGEDLEGELTARVEGVQGGAASRHARQGKPRQETWSTAGLHLGDRETSIGKE